ncbi:DUF5977 domain-containing protein [Pedobacter sp.]|uniref:DUF5977 domain-containing protein n=1 Tax=Pedobacter sp. TaxID=1411316 RepID=UPI00396C7915
MTFKTTLSRITRQPLYKKAKKINIREKQFYLKEKIVRNVLFLSLLLISFSSAFPQGLTKAELYRVTQASPNAAALGKAAEYPVGMYTGIPSISVPLYEINAGRIKLPVGVSYNASGIRVEEIASSVGLGWVLNAGGVITRSVQGMPDDEYFGFENFLTTTETVEAILAMGDNSANAPAFNTITKKIVGAKVDAQPDIYYFNFGGFSGKFMYHQQDKKFYSIPYSKLKIEANSTLDEFIITDENGIVYTFNDVERSTRSIDNPVEVKTAWYLTTIEDPINQSSVAFSYSRHTLSYETMGTEVHYFALGSGYSIDEGGGDKQNPVHQVTRLTKIVFDGGYINFIYGLDRCDLPNDKALTEVKVYSSNNQLVKDYDLAYGYFTAGLSLSSICGNPLMSPNARLKLLSINEYPTNGSHTDPLSHLFDYNTLELPSRMSKAQDHWGYYNGADGNTKLYPSYTYTAFNQPPIVLYGGNREVNEYFAKAGMLNKITYPTKGYTEFDFEGNKAVVNNLQTINQAVGGFRIEKIQNYDQNGSLTSVKKYKYVMEDNPSLSSGQSRFFPRYYETVSYTSNMNESAPVPCIKRYSQSSYPLVDEAGKSVGYSNVIEINGEGNGDGYIQYKFTNFSEYDDVESSGLSVSRPISFQWLRGLETERKVFKLTQSGKELVHSISNEYEKDLLGNLKKVFKGIRGVYINTTTDMVIEWPGEDYMFLGVVGASWETYPTYSDFVHLKKTIERTYNGPDYLESVKDYTYNSRNLKISEETSLSSDGQKTGITTKYVSDYIVNSATVPESIAIENLQISNYLNAPIEQYTYKILPNNDRILTGARYNSYNFNKQLNTIYSYKLPLEIQLNYQGLIVSPTLFSKSINYEADLVFSVYESGKLVEQKRADGIPISYLWSYANQYPIAEIKGVTYSEIESALGTSTIQEFKWRLSPDKTAIDNFIGSIQTIFPKIHITKYTYLPLVGLASQTSPTGNDTFYEYDQFNRLKNIKNRDGYIVKNYQYNYGQANTAPPTTYWYYNTLKSQTFVRNNCSTGLTGGEYTYVVPPRKYASYVSQAEADALADADIIANGQNQANIYGPCVGPAKANISVSSNAIDNSAYVSRIEVYNENNSALLYDFTSPTTAEMEIPYGTYWFKVTVYGEAYTAHDGKGYNSLKMSGTAVNAECQDVSSTFWFISTVSAGNILFSVRTETCN